MLTNFVQIHARHYNYNRQDKRDTMTYLLAYTDFGAVPGCGLLFSVSYFNKG